MKNPIRSMHGDNERNTVLREELVTYRQVGNQLTKESVVRVYSDPDTYTETMTQAPLKISKQDLEKLK